MVDKPLTLQQCCYLCLLTSPDPYTVGYLPTRLRRLLLVNMPTTNLCYLEGTPATEDVDMDAVWEEVASKRTVASHNSCHSTAFTGITPKDKFFIEIISEILEGSLLRAAAYLLGVYESERPFGIGDFYALPQSVMKYVHCTHHYPSHGACLIPPSHASGLHSILKKPYKYEKHEWKTLVKAVMDECHYFPKYVNIPLSYSPQMVQYRRLKLSTYPIPCVLPETDTWVSNPGAAADDLGKFVSATEEVTFLPRRADSTVKSHFTLGSILANSRPKLKAVILDKSCPSGFVDELIKKISPYLSDASYPSVSDSMYKPGVPIPQISLKSLVVEVGEHERGPHSNLPRELSIIIDHQSSLEKLHLEHLPPLTAEEYHPLYCSITTFVTRPQFREVTLTDIELPGINMQETLHHFLTSPSSLNQKIRLHKVTISNHKLGLSPERGASHVPLALSKQSAEKSCLPATLSREDKALHKSLHFSDITFPSDLATWLFHHSQLKLNTLHLANVQVLDNHALDLLQKQRNFQIENLVLCGKVVLNCPPFDYFDCVLTNPNLRNLQLRSCTSHSDMFLTSLIRGLLKQSKVGSLQHLALVDIELGRQSDSDLKLLFEAIFSLPQLATFALDLSNNKLTEQQIGMLCSTWIEQCGQNEKQLLYLRISDVDHYDVFSYSLEKLAIQTDFEADT